MTTKWIEVDPNLVNPPKREKVDGAEVTVLMSPYDIPTALRGYFDEDRDRFVIEFRYLADEDKKKESPRPHITLCLGKNSGRIYGIELEVQALEAPWVQIVAKALSERESQARKPRRTKNYEVARRLLRENEPELREAMAMVV